MTAASINGRPTDFPIDAAVTWFYTGGANRRGGYGYCIPVDGTVIGHEPTRVRIRVAKKNGEMVERCVHPARLGLKRTA